MKTIALFGATGKTGNEFLKLALAKGYRIKALVRNPEMVAKHTNLEIIKGDVLNPADVAATVIGTHLVISLFGHVKGSPEWLQTDGTKNIVNAMKANGIDEIISLSGGGLPFAEKDEPKFADKLIRFIMKVAVPKILNDAIAHADFLKTSGIKWTIVRGPRLTTEPAKNNYKVTWVGVNAGTSLTRADLAAFILTLVDNNPYIHQMPFVTN